MIGRVSSQTQHSPIDLILPLLNKVRQRQIGQWSACCPSHSDRNPSLSVREASNGAVLLRCFGGCSANEITSALGIDLSDLFPPREQSKTAPKRTPRLLTASQALQLLREEAMLTLVAASNQSLGVNLTENDRARLLKAVGRIEYLCVESLGIRHD
jgi:hypothetical protein